MASSHPATASRSSSSPTGPEAGTPAFRADGVSRRWTLALLSLVVLAGAAARTWGIDFGLPHTQARPDETQVMDVALNYLRGDFWPAFYDYPRLYNYALILAYLAYYAVGAAAGWFTSLGHFLSTWPTHWAPFFLINRSLSAAAGTAVIIVVYALGRRVGGWGTGLVAALFMALAYGHVRDSHFGTTDTTLVLLCAASVLWLVAAQQAGERWGRRDLVAAALAGLAAATKYNAVILLLPLGLSQVLHAWRRPSSSARIAALLDRRAFALAAVFGLAFAVGIPFVFFDYAKFSSAMHDMSAVLKVGLTPQDRVNGWWYHLAVSLRYGVGLPLLAFAAAGMAVIARRDWRMALLLFSFPLAYFGVAGSLGALFVRYAWPIVPFLCVAAAAAVWAVADLLAAGAARVLPRARGVGRERAVAAACAVLLAAALAWPSVSRIAGFDRVIAQADSRVVAADWIARHAEPGASVMVSGSPYGSPQFPRQFKHWTWHRELRRFTYRGQPMEGRPDWILVQESPLPSATQPLVEQLLQSGYDRLSVIKAFAPGEARNHYDKQDAFFVPFASFRQVRRPGPNFTIYKLASARYVANPDDRVER